VTCLLAEGHLLVEDVPGVGKTTLAKALAATVSGDFGRVQFTPDLMAADLLGTSVWNPQQGSFEFRHGPVFANVVLADEINRAAPKVQSALLESMAEDQVTVDGTTRPLPRPFMVVATQNPIEQHGTYPLPESQLDRFLMRISIGYPDPRDEDAVLRADGEQRSLAELRPVVSSRDVLTMIEHCRKVHVSATLRRYLLDLATATRRHRSLTLGMSPRAVLGLQRAARVRAATDGRDHALPDDVVELARIVVDHRLVLHPEARIQEISGADVVADVLRTVPVPDEPR
jgi:MoxR-like ATPase